MEDMVRKILTVMVLVLVMTGANAQKIDQRLTGLVEQVNNRRAQGLRPLNVEGVKKSIAVRFNADGSIKTLSAIGLLKKGAECPTEQLQQLGIEMRYQLGDMVVMNIPPDKLQLLDGVDAFYSVRADEILQPMNSLARQETQADKVSNTMQAVANGLPRAFTGNGVVLGVIDVGIDFNHAAFRKADGSTRIKKAIVYTKDGKIEFDNESDIMALTSDLTVTSHGTHTSATAGGSEVGNGMQGVAPEADLVLCGLGSNASSTNIAECIRTIFDYAASVNKPAVVSLSMGNIVGLHDGSETTAKAVSELTENGTKPGRAVVISSANAADKSQSVITYPGAACKTVLGAATVPESASDTKPITYNGNYFFYASDYKDFTLELKLVNLTNGQVMELDEHAQTVSDDKPISLEILPYSWPMATGGTAYCGYLNLSGENSVKLDNKNYRLAVFATPSNESQMIKMMGGSEDNLEPCFDAPTTIGGYNFASNGYTKGSGDFAFSTSICNDAVISVGAYVTRSSWENKWGNIYGYQPSKVTGAKQEYGEIADFSSYGVDDNGVPRPTIIAPGMGLVSAANNYDQGLFVNGQPGEPTQNSPVLISLMEQNNRNNWYYLTQGTSMSCPHAAGIVTLWMQAKPTLTSKEIQETLKVTCRNDAFTTNETLIPSGNKVQAGYGKIDALAGLKSILGITGIETVEAGGHREATPATMYSVDAPVYNMMGQRVDKNTRGMVIYKGHKYVNK